MLETPIGPKLDSRESEVGTQKLLEEMSSKHNAQVVAHESHETPMQEAMGARSDAIGALDQAKENLGAVATGQPAQPRSLEVGPDGQVVSKFDRKHDGANAIQPVGVGGRVV
jgi:hypothetical protein